MSIQTQIDRISESVSAALTALTEKGVTVPDGTKVDGLAALISAIESGGGGTAISEVDQWLIDFWHQRTRFAYAFYYQSSIENIPLIDTSNGTDFSYMFYSCPSLTTIPQLDVSNGTVFSYMFGSCSKLTTIPQLDVSNGSSFDSMFRNCSSLTTIHQLDVSNGRNFSNMFQSCSKLTTIPQLDVSNGSSFGNMFNYCSSLTTISFAEGCIKRAISFAQSSLLSGESVQSIIDGLADLTGGPYQKVTFHSDIVDKLTDEQKQQVTDKNWTIG